MIFLFEGIDGSGKTTLVSRLSTSLPEAAVYKFPRYTTPSGAAIARMLRKPRPDIVALQALMAVNRIEALAELRKYENEGLCFIDRYTPSGFAYSPTMLHPWVEAINAPCALNITQTFYLQMRPTESFSRRPTGRDSFESDLSRIERAAATYDRLFTDGWTQLDATLSRDELVRLVMRKIEEFR